MYKDRADKAGVELASIMDEKEKQRQKKRFLETVITQAEGVSRFDSEYARKIKPIKEIFEQEIEKMKTAA
jgi:carbamate kinase